MLQHRWTAFFVVLFTLGLAHTAQAQCGAGLPAFPTGCCNGTTAASCFSGSEFVNDCAPTEASPNQGCVWSEALVGYTCGDTTMSPLTDPSGLNPRECTAMCTGDCTGKVCGTDGCGGSCGDCSSAGSGAFCNGDNQCECTPDCTGKVCGDDGCGGSCGTCSVGFTCDEQYGSCETCTPQCAGKVCGDDGCGGSCGDCFVGETCSADGTVCNFCTPDCTGKVCGDDGCGGVCGTCAGGQTCNAAGQCGMCTPDCTGKVCGDDGCGGSCGTCSGAETCSAAGQCEACTPDCTGRVCGNDGCGGSCGPSCPNGETCTAAGQCEATSCDHFPPDGCCMGTSFVMCTGGTPDGENCADRGQVCGINFLDGLVGCGDAFDVTQGMNECPQACSPQCEGKVCGDDGCGGSCGECTGGATCNASGQCDMCVPDCEGKVCGSDGCGGTCGSCPTTGPDGGTLDPAPVCLANGTCGQPARTCDDVPAGGCCDDQLYMFCDGETYHEVDCAAQGLVCSKRVLSRASGCWPSDQAAGGAECGCVPQCDGKSCGDDGCGGTCGNCGLGMVCDGLIGECVNPECPDVPGVGCCDGDVLKTCDASGTKSVDCGDKNLFCGWSDVDHSFICTALPDNPGSFDRVCPGAPTCTPDCTGKTCGDDGCGGSCGACGAGESCDLAAGSCVPDTYCSTKRNGGCCIDEQTLASCATSTSAPKRVQCVDMVQDPATGAFTNQLKCGYKDGAMGCVPVDTPAPSSWPIGETEMCPAGCIPACVQGDECGDDGCGGSCGSCGAGESCSASPDGTGGTCEEACVPNCAYAACGDDGCGGSCGSCAEGQVCSGFQDIAGNNYGTCVDPTCGDIPEGGCCDGKVFKRCASNILLETNCNSGYRRTQTCGWNDDTAAYGCGVNGGKVAPDGTPRECPGTMCVPDCDGKTCGSDGCGGTCGSCGDGEFCDVTFGVCVDDCVNDGAFGSAGCCSADGRFLRNCKVERSVDFVDGQRVFTYTSTEYSTQCAYNSCKWLPRAGQYGCYPGGTIDEDPSGENPRVCDPPACEPRCDGRTCGDDGCGGSCGSCGDGEICTRSGTCFNACASAGVTDVGRCNHATREWCDDGVVKSESCYGQPGRCGWNAQTESYTCGTDGFADPSGTHPLGNQDCTFEPGECGWREGCGAWGCGAGETCGSRVTLAGGGEMGVCEPKAVLGPSCIDKCKSTVTNAEIQYARDNAGVCLCAESWCDPVSNSQELLRIRGCCLDYDHACNDAPPPETCGDGLCYFDAGENCETCPSDCGACTFGTGDNTPPWQAPYSEVVNDRFGPNAAVDAIHPLDDVMPTSAPMPQKGLMAHVPSTGSNAGPPGARWTSPPGLSAQNTTDGVAGPGIQFAYDTAFGIGAYGQPVDLALDGTLPTALDTTGTEPGGFSVAFWAKTLESTPNNVLNPLITGVRAADGQADTRQICARASTNSTRLHMRCPTFYAGNGGAGARQTTIKSIDVYWGEAPAFFANGQQCPTLREIGVDGSCQADVGQLGQNCVGQSYCSLEAPALSCAGDKVLYARAVCGGSTVNENPVFQLFVEPGPAGETTVATERQLSMRAAYTSKKSELPVVRQGEWQHYALTFQPLPGPLALRAMPGRTTVYVDGDAVYTTDLTPMALMRAFRIGTGPVYSFEAGRYTNTALGNNLASYTSMDEVVIYDRALARREVRALAGFADFGLMRMWPARPATDVKDSLLIRGGEARTVPVSRPHLSDPSESTRFQDTRLFARDDALRLGENVFFRQHSPTTDSFTSVQKLTLLAWVRLPTLSADKPLLTLKQGDTVRVELRTASADGSCGTRGVTATLGSSTLAPRACGHGLAAGRWAQIALSQSEAGQTLYIDGEPVAHNATAASALFTEGSLTFETGDGVDFYWAGLFDRALPLRDLIRLRGMGPAVWLDGATYSADGATHPRDYGAFDIVSDTDVADVRLWAGNAASTAAASASPLLLRSAQDEALTVDIGARFPRVDGDLSGGNRQFTWLARVPATTGTAPLFTQRFRRRNVDYTLFAADLDCDAAANTCRLSGHATAASGARRDWASEAFVMPEASVQDLRVAVGFDGAQVVASLGLPEGTTTADGLNLGLTRVLPVAMQTARTRVPSAEPATHLPENRLEHRPTTGTQSLHMLRVYPRALSLIELNAVVTDGCSASFCGGGGTACVDRGDDVLAVCGDCEDGYVRTSDAYGDVCVPATPLFERCHADAACASGTCERGRCVDPTTDHQACNTVCEGLGRACQQTEGNNWTCSEECKPHFEPATSRSLQCVWKPALEDGVLCESDDACLSGHCVKERVPVYQVFEIDRCESDGSCMRAEDFDVWGRERNSDGSFGPNQYFDAFCAAPYNSDRTSDFYGVYGAQAPLFTKLRKCPPYVAQNTRTGYGESKDIGRCAVRDVRMCEAQKRKPAAHRVTDRQGLPSTVYSCGSCSDLSYAGRPLYVSGWRFLKPSLCKTMIDKQVTQAIKLKARDPNRVANVLSYNSEPSPQFFKTLLLDKVGAVTPREYSRMEQMGVGLPLLNYSRMPAAEKAQFQAKYGRYLRATACAQDEPENETYFVASTHPSPFHDLDENRKICLPNKFPNGTPCPPPGANVPASEGDRFCESGFCARDTKVCEDGFGILEVTEDASRSDDKNNRRSDLGPIALVQTNNTSMETRKNRQTNDGTAKKRLLSLSTSNAHSVRFFGSRAREVLRVQKTLRSRPDDQKASYSSGLYVLGVQIPQTGNPATTCGANTWQNGEYQAPDQPCSVAKTPSDLVPALPTVKACVPMPGGCDGYDPTKPQSGKMCVRSTSFVGPVPITVEASLKMDICVGAGTSVDSQTYEPAFKIEPSIGLGVDVRGGVGGSFGPVEVFAGARAAITVVQLAFPITWGLQVAKVPRDKDGAALEDLYTVKYQRKVSAELTLLKLAMSLFAEAGVSIFSVEWEQIVFEFGGYVLSWDLATKDIQSTKVDLQHHTAELD